MEILTEERVITRCWTAVTDFTRRCLGSAQEMLEHGATKAKGDAAEVAARVLQGHGINVEVSMVLQAMEELTSGRSPVDYATRPLQTPPHQTNAGHAVHVPATDFGNNLKITSQATTIANGGGGTKRAHADDCEFENTLGGYLRASKRSRQQGDSPVDEEA